MTYRLFVNDERTVLVRIWGDGPMEVATRESSSHTWGPPVSVQEEDTDPFSPSSEQKVVRITGEQET